MNENQQLNESLKKPNSENFHLQFDIGQNYFIHKSLGSGSFGNVYVIMNSKKISPDRYAVKTSLQIFHKDRDLLDYINKLLLDNPAILKIKNIQLKCINSQFYDQNHLIITTNYMPKGSLNQENNLSNMNQIDQYISILGIAFGMQYLHSFHIVHGNLKLSNVFLDEYSHPLISDFGLSKYNENNFLNKNSIIFIAPEILNEKIIEPDFKTDVYSYAFVVYSILTKQVPKIDKPLYLFIQDTIKGRRPNFINNCINKLLQKCWSSNPSERPSFDEIIEVITSPKFVSCFQIDTTKVRDYLGLFTSKQPIVKRIYEKFSYSKNTSEENSMKTDNSRTKNISEPNSIKDEASENKFSVALSGAPCAGKTTFILAYLRKNVPITPTIGVDRASLKVQTENGEVELIVYDSSGTERWENIAFSYIKNAEAIIFFINVESRDDIKRLQYIINEIECSNKLCYLIPTHCNNKWNITKEEILSFAKKNHLRLCKASYDDYDSMDSLFKTIANDLIAKPNEIAKIDQDVENDNCIIH